MGKSLFSVSVMAAIFLFFACSTSSVTTEQVSYPNHPRSILVMPPVNLSVDVNAAQTFLATSTYPLAEAGYYVIPVALSTQMFIQNGVTVAEEALTIPHDRLREIFGADAALYITIFQYGAIYYVIGSAVVASASARLVDLRSSEELWSGRVEITDTSNNNGSLSYILFGALFDQIANTVFNVAYDVGRRANHQLLSAERREGILYGPYHSRFGAENR